MDPTKQADLELAAACEAAAADLMGRFPELRGVCVLPDRSSSDGGNDPDLGCWAVDGGGKPAADAAVGMAMVLTRRLAAVTAAVDRAVATARGDLVALYTAQRDAGGRP